MAKTSGKNIADLIGDYFSPRSFLICFLGLILLSIAGGGFIILSTASSQETEVATAPTGKVMASVQVVEAPQPKEEPAEEPTKEPVKEEKVISRLPPPPPTQTEENLAAPETPETPETPEIEDSITGLSETSVHGALPITRQSDGLTVFEAYKAPFSLNAKTKGVIALVLVDYGLSESMSKSALQNLPPAINFATSPYAENIQQKISAARGKGFETWMTLPTQPTNFTSNDTGSLSILATLNETQNMKRLYAILGRATGYVGVTFINSPDISENSIEFQKVMQSIQKRGLGITQLSPTDDLVKHLATEQKTPFIQSNLWLDTDVDKTSIAQFLSKTETQAIENGYVVAAFHPSPLTIHLISDWQKTLSAKNIQLAPLTYAIHQHNLMK